MPTPTFPTLGATTVHRKWLFEVNTGTALAPVWTAIGGINNSQFNPDSAVLQDDSDMNSLGAGSQTKTAGNATASLTLMRKVGSDGISYDVGQEYLRAHAINVYGPGNSVQLRISEYTPGGGPRIEAYVGKFAAGWEVQAGDQTALDSVVVTLTGQGQCAAVTHPYPAAAAIPTLAACVPGTSGTIATAGGVLVHIYGTGFLNPGGTGVTGASGVTFGGTNATNYSVENDGLIIATAPAKTAGSVNLVVTNGTGASANLAVTYA